MLTYECLYVSQIGVCLPFMPVSAFFCSISSHKNSLWRLCTIPFEHVQTISWTDWTLWLAGGGKAWSSSVRDGENPQVGFSDTIMSQVSAAR